jgi:hypothetical protein
MWDEDHQCVSPLLVEVQVRTGGQGFHVGWNGSQQREVQFVQLPRRVNQKNAGRIPGSYDQGPISSIQRGSLA